ncbi:MAG: heme exporter protein CcmD [Burkholderiaceae bacterium]
MGNATFYIVGAYGMTALAVAIELLWLRRHRRAAIKRAIQSTSANKPE